MIYQGQTPKGTFLASIQIESPMLEGASHGAPWASLARRCLPRATLCASAGGRAGPQGPLQRAKHSLGELLQFPQVLLGAWPSEAGQGRGQEQGASVLPSRKPQVPLAGAQQASACRD